MINLDLNTAKLVFAGPVGAGKTTAIRSISDEAPISTEMPLTDGPIGEKTTTTVALDFSTIMLDDDTPLLVYGLPGQDHFSFMWPIVLEGAVGVVLMLNATDEAIAEHCEAWLRSIRDISAEVAIVVGITKTDVARAFRIQPVRDAIRRCGTPLPVFTLDARDRSQTSHLVRALLMTLA